MSARCTAGRTVALLGVLGSLAGCAAQPAYDGERRTRDEVAVVRGDPPVSAGLPVSVRLRKVDARVLKATDWRVELLPGSHVLLVDCVTLQPARTQRFEVPVAVEPGGHYRMVADVGTVNEGCLAVRLEAQ